MIRARWRSVVRIDGTRSASGRSWLIVDKALSRLAKPTRLFKTRGWIWMPQDCPAASTFFNAILCCCRAQRIATREIRGNASLSSSSLFGSNSGRGLIGPVMLPPGLARLTTNPAFTGSIAMPIMTIGIVRVSRITARTVAGPGEMTRTSTLRRTSSAVSSGSRPRLLSAYRYSIKRFFPSVYPSSRRPCRNILCWGA